MQFNAFYRLGCRQISCSHKSRILSASPLLHFASAKNMVQLLEDRRIKVGIISGFEHFDTCTFTYSTQSCKVENDPIIVTKDELSGDRQGFNVGHDLGHLILDIEGDFKSEQAANRFTGAFLVPTATARVELGTNRTNLNINELQIWLEHKSLDLPHQGSFHYFRKHCGAFIPAVSRQ